MDYADINSCVVGKIDGYVIDTIIFICTMIMNALFNLI